MDDFDLDRRYSYMRETYIYYDYIVIYSTIYSQVIYSVVYIVK